MFLTETSAMGVTKKQYLYKLKANFYLFYYFIIMQLLALLITGGGMSMTSMGFENFNFTVRGASGEMVITFTIIWILILSIAITIKSNKNNDFAFISNRLTSNLSNIAFLLTCSVVGGVTSGLSAVVIRLYIYFTKGSGYIIKDNFYLSPGELITGVLAVTLYLIILSAIGYLGGSLIQFHKIFIIILPVIIFLLFRFSVSSGAANSSAAIFEYAKFFTSEKSLGIFFIKIITSSVVLFGLSTLITNGVEVKR